MLNFENPKSNTELLKNHQTDGTMRKYKQLTLTLVAVMSLVAFLFYKHEYERLRYTLEYLDTFGEPPSDLDSKVKPPCGYSTHQRLSTPPVDWVQVTQDLQVYSAFWDAQSGLGDPRIKAVAAVQKIKASPLDLGCLLWFETEERPISGTCYLEPVVERMHGLGNSVEHDMKIVQLLCSCDNKKLMLSKIPYKIQFTVGPTITSGAIFVHETEYSKNIIRDRTAMCVLPVRTPVDTLRIMEFFAFHHIVGVERFVIYGSLLTPLARKLLDKYSQELGIVFEEKLFSDTQDFKMSKLAIRKVIELDCILRHRDTQENILVLSIDEYFIPNHKSTLQEILASLTGSGNRNMIVSEFHLSTQRICLDSEHIRPGKLLLNQQTHTHGTAKEEGVAIMRPHLVTSPADKNFNMQHISAGTALIHHYITCPSGSKHVDTHHLPTLTRYTVQLEKSLLIRKWKIYQ